MLFVFLCHMLWSRWHIEQKLYPINKTNVAFWLLLGLFAAQLLATIFSLDFRHSFFGSPYRGGGFITYGFYILFAALSFLVIKSRDWRKLWNFSIFVGVLVCVLAIISRLGLFSNFLIARIDNISSTIGGPNTLALYLMLLVFPTLSYAISEKKIVKKILYFASFLLFCFIIFLTISQGAYLGLGMGMVYFLFFFPTKHFSDTTRKKIRRIKIAAVVLMVVVITGIVFIKSNPQYSLNNQYLFHHLTTWKIDQSRLSTWQVSIKAFLDRPILGYGPENFSIGFDQNYDPSLPLLEMEPDTPASWWDKAHNFAINLLVETGIVGFAAFALLFGWIFWRLHKMTHQKTDQSDQRYTEHNPLITHGIQTALIAYFSNLMFNFENFSSYILVFLIVGYALYLMVPQASLPDQKQANVSKGVMIKNFLFRKRKIIAGSAFVFLLCFLWFFTIKPFNTNAQINKALYLSGTRRCNQGLFIMNKELKKHSITSGYLRIKYIDVIKNCIQFYPENDVTYAKLVIDALKENVSIMPHYTRNWLIIAAFNNILITGEEDLEKKNELISQSREYLKKAEVLSPGRHEVLVETINLYLFEENYELARQISENCTQEYPDFNSCYWYLGLSQIYLSQGNESLLQEGKTNMEKAQKMKYSQLSNYSLAQLAFLYIGQANYKELEWVYQKLTEYNPYNLRYFAGLALVYKKNGKLEESRQALKNLLSSQSDELAIEKGLVEEGEAITLLIENILELKESNPTYHTTLYQLQLELGNWEKARKEAERYYELYIQQNPTLTSEAKSKLNAMLLEIEKQRNK